MAAVCACVSVYRHLGTSSFAIRQLALLVGGGRHRPRVILNAPACATATADSAHFLSVRT